ncbi:hypothetical protein, partial [Paraburkholderia tropica]|uniref:hypothetical protein n=1 Tax=Paraburkholderia tropica TaxID=92647 RepID=UPI002AB11A7F
DDELREWIVQTYARMRGLIYSLQLNNGLVNELKQFEIFHNGPDKEARLEQLRTVLRDYATQVLQRDQAIAAGITKLIPMMKQWLASHTAH